jgi:uncharacterized protein (TIGR02996 family)
MTDSDAFESALDELFAGIWPRPGELAEDAGLRRQVCALRLVYADWLEERGDPYGALQRWLARHGKFPRLSGPTWDWWRFGDRPDSQPEDLPAAIWRRLAGRPLEQEPSCKEFASRRAAERALFKALKLLDGLD